MIELIQNNHKFREKFIFKLNISVFILDISISIFKFNIYFNQYGNIDIQFPALQVLAGYKSVTCSECGDHGTDCFTCSECVLPVVNVFYL